MRKKPDRTLFLFYLLVFYILLQFVWWSFLLMRLTSEVTAQKEAALRLQPETEERFQAERLLLEKKHSQRIAMIAGEGSVFLLLLVLGIYRVKRSFEKETALARQQRNFMLSVTHELKTPLSAIKLNLQTLQKRKLDEDTTRELLQLSVQETDRLNLLLENVLLASRMEMPDFALQMEKVDLNDFLAHQIKATFSLSDRIVFTRADNAFVITDKLALSSVTGNLIENALKYSAGKVDVRLVKSTGEVVIEVEDEGTGVPEAEREQIFNKFYRVGNEETRNTKGTGLGLFIVKYLSEKMGAEVSIVTGRKGGALFRVLFRSAD